MAEGGKWVDISESQLAAIRSKVIEECAQAIHADRLPPWAERRAINALVHLKHDPK